MGKHTLLILTILVLLEPLVILIGAAEIALAMWIHGTRLRIFRIFRRRETDELDQRPARSATEGCRGGRECFFQQLGDVQGIR